MILSFDKINLIWRIVAIAESFFYSGTDLDHIAEWHVMPG